jgi:Zn-dependent peptidase ImmA (M78 family)
VTLRRGLKAEAERAAVEARRRLALAPHDPLNPAELVQNLGLEVLDASTLVELSKFEELEKLEASAFSAATFEIKGKKIIIYNPLRSDARRNSDVAHELAHVMLNHGLPEIRDLGGMTFRTCRPNEEEGGGDRFWWDTSIAEAASLKCC